MEIVSRLTAMLLFIVLSPILIGISIVNLIIQGKPIIFRQIRIGMNFEEFIIYKFRTMDIQTNNNAFNSGENKEVNNWGKFLRKTKLDELPQLVNVIKGDMRFIGPRPEVPEFVDKKTFTFLNTIKPGLSGYSSILFRNESEIWSMIESDDPYKEILKIKIGLDRYYVNKKSFLQDLKLVFITMLSLFIPKRMGHYLLIKLLNIEDDEEINIRKIINNAKIKQFKSTSYFEKGYKNLRILIYLDIISVLIAFLLSVLIKNDFNFPNPLQNETINSILFIVVAIKLSSFSFFGLYKGMWRYTSLSDIYNITKSNLLSSFILLVAANYFQGFHNIAQSIFLIDFAFCLGLTCGSRIAIRQVYTHLINPKNYKMSLNNKIILIGAGETGEFICKELLNNSNHGMEPILFLEDDTSLHGKSIHGIKVFGRISEIVHLENQYDEILICCPNAPRKNLYKIIELCKSTGKPYRTLPSADEVISGRLSVNQVKDVSIIDLLGRNEVVIDKENINNYINGKRVLITGAGGSIGSELVRQCLKFEPALLVMLDNSEFNLFQIEREVLSKSTSVLTKPLLSNIRDMDILTKVYNEYQPQVVFHAAAYKHVAMQEAFPWEAINTNVNGTANLVKLSLKHNVDKFVLVSTDKAVKPINVMGATKRLAELICQGANDSYSTRFMSVRFGNVLGSSGSVIPIFQEQIRSGGPLTITDIDMERYFMSASEAAQLILEAGSIGEGGEIFALDMGKPIKILDIATELIRLSGLEPDIDIPISYIGPRPGEKKLEELFYDSKQMQKTSNDKILKILPEISSKNIEKITKIIMNSELSGNAFKNSELIKLLSTLVPDYNPLDKDMANPILLKVKPRIEA